MTVNEIGGGGIRYAVTFANLKGTRKSRIKILVRAWDIEQARQSLEYYLRKCRASDYIDRRGANIIKIERERDYGI